MVEAGEADTLCEACWKEADDMTAAMRVSVADALPPLFCGECRKVHVLRQENAVAMDIFMDCRSQQIRSEGALLGLNHAAIRAEVEDRVPADKARSVYERLLAAERELVTWASEQREKQDRERESKRKLKKAGA